MQHESLCEGLAHVYERLVPDPHKLWFRQAIGDVLRDHSDCPDAASAAFQDLIYLLVRTRATESLTCCFPQSSTDRPVDTDPACCLMRLQRCDPLAPSAYAYQTAREVVSAANFDDGYLFEAIKVLVECEPSQVAVVVRELEPRLSRSPAAGRRSSRRQRGRVEGVFGGCKCVGTASLCSRTTIVAGGAV